MAMRVPPTARPVRTHPPGPALPLPHAAVRSSRSRLLPVAATPASAPPPDRPAAITGDWAALPIRHVVESQQFSRPSLDLIFDTALQMEGVAPGSPDASCLHGRIMSTLFYEPSTRTRLSFESAMCRLGGRVLSTESAGEYSSAAKGETLEGDGGGVGGWRAGRVEVGGGSVGRAPAP